MVGSVVFARLEDGELVEVQPLWVSIPPRGDVVMLDLEGRGRLVAMVDHVVWRNAYAVVLVDHARLFGEDEYDAADQYADVIDVESR